MDQDHHAIELRHHANGVSGTAVYALCTCGWEGERRPLTRVSAADGRDTAVIAAEAEGQHHLEEVHRFVPGGGEATGSPGWGDG